MKVSSGKHDKLSENNNFNSYGNQLEQPIHFTNFNNKDESTTQNNKNKRNSASKSPSVSILPPQLASEQLDMQGNQYPQKIQGFQPQHFSTRQNSHSQIEIAPVDHIGVGGGVGIAQGQLRRLSQQQNIENNNKVFAPSHENQTHLQLGNQNASNNHAGVFPSKQNKAQENQQKRTSAHKQEEEQLSINHELINEEAEKSHKDSHIIILNTEDSDEYKDKKINKDPKNTFQSDLEANKLQIDDIEKINFDDNNIGYSERVEDTMKKNTQIRLLEGEGAQNAIQLRGGGTKIQKTQDEFMNQEIDRSFEISNQFNQPSVFLQNLEGAGDKSLTIPKQLKLNGIREITESPQPKDQRISEVYNSNNWYSTQSPDLKLARFTHQPMLNNSTNKDIGIREEDNNNNNNNLKPEVAESLIQFDDVNSRESAQNLSHNKGRFHLQLQQQQQIQYLDDRLNINNNNNNNSNSKRYSNQNIQIIPNNQSNVMEFKNDNITSYEERNKIENSSKLDQFENNHLFMSKQDDHFILNSSKQEREDQDDNHKKDLGVRKELGIRKGESNYIQEDQQEENENMINNENDNLNSQIKDMNVMINNKEKKVELEQKQKNRIQKFCPKFFKDKLKNRSGIPTLTQINRTMTVKLEPEQQIIANGSGHYQKSYTEGLLNDDLRKELENIEEHQKYRVVMDAFVSKFSRSPKEAIQYLIEKKLCEDTPEDIAYTILTTEGLNKEKLGIFFGSHQERNQLILEAFCSLMDFRGLQFDEAIRLFLSRFRLPGEAQQIDRIITKFTAIYCNDNPTQFQDEDSPYILCYAAIMLNVDAHSEKIEKKNKMQKQKFVTINLQCTKNAVTKEFLENLFDNIVKEKFETKIDYVEKICSRLPVESMAKQFDGQTRIKVIKALQVGSMCMKYGRKGQPHMRLVCLSDQLDKVMWSEKNPEPLPQKSIQQKAAATATKHIKLDPQNNNDNKENNQHNNNNSNSNSNYQGEAVKQKKCRSINVSDIIDLALGSNTTEVMRKNKVPIEFDPLCISIFSKNRTLDIKCQTMETKAQWIAFIYNHLNDQRLAIKKKLILTPEAKTGHIERISDIWRIDVFSKWDTHWDYASSKPKQFVKYEVSNSTKQKKTFFASVCSCIPAFKNSQRNDLITSSQRDKIGARSSQFSDYDEIESVSQHNKSLLLISLWKVGMPKWVRKTLWPLAIGNRLEITENLYKILLKQVQITTSKVNEELTNIQITQSITKMKEDLQKLKVKTLHASLTEKQFNQLESILSAFIFYRPDIGYIPGAMANLAAVLIHHIDDEYTVFKCFINLLHSHHFLTFFRGEMSEIKWRVQFFNQYLHIKMPFVLAHFKALDLSSELFLMHWFLNLFSNVFDLETVFRIWDNFLLEGEIYAFKAGLAFIEYFHLEFKISTFEDAILLLKNPPEDIFCHDIYFQLAEENKISLADFNDRLAQQNVAKLAPQILQQLL